MMIVTIDGPAGAGKSTVARALASRLGVAYVDTGAMYRAVALAALGRGISVDDADALSELARACAVELGYDPAHPSVCLEGRDVTAEVRSMPVSRVTGRIARVPGVRAALVQRQRDIGRTLGSLVSEGRDQGSVVFPDADHKFLLEASLHQRARRRFDEMTGGPDGDANGPRYQEIVSNLEQRDAGDAVEWAPLRAAGRATTIDASDLSVEDVVARMIDVIHPGRADG